MTTDAETNGPVAGMVVSVVVSLLSISMISSFLTQKYASVKTWRMLPCAMWLALCIYVDSFMFVFFTAILKFGLGLNSSYAVCDGAILLCLIAYISTKVLIYSFLVEKSYVIRGALTPRMKSKLWLFNTFGMLGAYGVVIILNFVYRIARFEGGQCVIGMERKALLPLIIFDLVLNVYLTLLFLIPVSTLHSFRSKEKTQWSAKVHRVAVRTFIGSLCTLLSSIVNLSVLTALDGEPGWLCLLCCNSDVLFSALMVYWVTFHDHVGSHRSDMALHEGGLHHAAVGRLSSTTNRASPIPPKSTGRSNLPDTLSDTRAFHMSHGHSQHGSETMGDDLDLAGLRISQQLGDS